MGSFNRIIIVTAVLYSIISFAVFHNVYNTVHTVIDEEFHIPQGMAYCNFNFSVWNHKITTLPGLYIVSTILLGPLHLCSTYWLRFVNYLGGVINMCLFVILFGAFNEKINNREKLSALLSAFNLSILPPLFFFTNLYYTDVVSVMFILLLLIFNKTDKHVLASACGLLSVIMRQTNIIWVGMLLVDYTVKQLYWFCRSKPISRRETGTVRSFEVKEKDVAAFQIDDVWKLRNFKRIPKQIVINICSYVSVILLFVIFLVVNEGIVLGDKSAHITVIHVPQLFYFSMFCIVFAWPHFLYFMIPFLKYVKKTGILYVLSAIAIMVIIVRINTLVHPYLLADNRHYTFYIWKRFYENIPLFRYIVIPIYLFGIYSLVSSVYSRNDITFAFAYFPCTIFVLILQKMIEIRYFLIPFLIFRLRVRQPLMTTLLTESLTYLLMNIVTL
ncbi:hypothetical protein AMK59_5080, partial [Oryctes borbonicus]